MQSRLCRSAASGYCRRRRPRPSLSASVDGGVGSSSSSSSSHTFLSRAPTFSQSAPLHATTTAGRPSEQTQTAATTTVGRRSCSTLPLPASASASGVTLKSLAGRRYFHGGTRPGLQSAVAAAATQPVSPNDNGDEDEDEIDVQQQHLHGMMDIDDEEVRRFAESGLAQLLAEESEAFERFDGSGTTAGRGGKSLSETMMQQHLDGGAEATPQRRQMAEILADFDPAKPPPDGSSLEDVQIWLECESQHESVLKIEKIIDDARARKDFGSLTAVQRQLLRWYQPLRNRIAAEQRDFLKGREQGTKQKQTGQNVYGPYLCSLQPEKLAVILAHEATMLAVVRGGDAKLTNMAFKIGDAIEAEVHVQKLLRKRAVERARFVRNRQEEDDDGDEVPENANTTTDVGGAMERSDEIKAESQDAIVNGATASEDGNEIGSPDETPPQQGIDDWMYGGNHLNQFIEEMNRGDPMAKQTKLRVQHAKRRALKLLESEEEWPTNKKVQIGAFLIKVLLDETTVNLEGLPEEDDLFDDISSGEPAFMYEKRWLDKKKNTGHIAMNPRLYKLIIEDKFESVVGNTTRHQPMVVPPLPWASPTEGGYRALNADFMRTHGCQVQQEALKHSDLSTVFDGLNVLGSVPWVINKKILNVAQKCWEDGIVLGEIPSRTDFEVPPKPIKPEMREDVNYKDKESPGYKEAIEEYKLYREASVKYNRISQKNMDLRSLRCSLLLKLNQAEKFKNFESIYFPYNVDFRGRAYPIPPHLSNIGSDLSRGLLKFKESKPLGPRGLYWLKVHLANFAGADKMSFDDRAGFVDKNMEHVRAAVDDPFGEDRWWMDLDDPLQGLATCQEIVNAIDSGDPESYECSLPVHMDGSCNGLQHYAALGRDRIGGKAVNLCQYDEPQDVYIGVMEEVIRRVAEEAATTLNIDSSDPDKLSKSEREKLKCNRAAKLVDGHIDRGVVKRTVMTSVYGVTFIGARKQIQEKIEEKLEAQGLDVDEREQEIHAACGYLATVTMDVMGELFQGARQTMNWLATCARLISSQGQPVAWISPTGIPAVQPYRLKKPYTIVTLLQSIVLTNTSDSLPIHRQRQVTAFPPNYVHSLDSSHMLLTALEMDRRGLVFSAVHDSFWTHAADIDEMNDILRESFVDLYNRPLLEELKRGWELRYPNLDFPAIPKRGDLDIEEVKKAPYFFQ